MRKLASTCLAVTVVVCEGWSKTVILHNLLMNAKATSTARAQIEAMMAITAVREPSPDCWFSRESAVVLRAWWCTDVEAPHGPCGRHGVRTGTTCSKVVVGLAPADFSLHRSSRASASARAGPVGLVVGISLLRRRLVVCRGFLRGRLCVTKPFTTTTNDSPFCRRYN